MIAGYRRQVELLIRVMAFVAKEPVFALHGGTAINLFLEDMPRLSVDIDVTYVPVEPRDPSLEGICQGLERIAAALQARLRGVAVILAGGSKLAVQSGRAAIKVEVNTTMRGLLAPSETHSLCARAQDLFDMDVAAPLAPAHQIYGGKLIAALDRQHPRDLFDVRGLLRRKPLHGAGKLGFMLGLLSSERPFHEILNPPLRDQRAVLENQFAGMTEEPFGYAAFEDTRRRLIAMVRAEFSAADKRFLHSVMAGEPDWEKGGYGALAGFPGVQWKLLNIRTLIRENPSKHREQSALLEEALGSTMETVP